MNQNRNHNASVFFVKEITKINKRLQEFSCTRSWMDNQAINKEQLKGRWELIYYHLIGIMVKEIIKILNNGSLFFKIKCQSMQ